MNEEETLVAELECLGIRYLSRQTALRVAQARPPDLLLADLIRQPSARVRTAVIAVLLAHPEYAEAVPTALRRLSTHERLLLEFFYTAAMLLQREYAERLQRFVITRWRWLPPLPETTGAWTLPSVGSSREKLTALGQAQRRWTQTAVNWPGTYENVARHLLRHWELEEQWKS